LACAETAWAFCLTLLIAQIICVALGFLDWAIKQKSTA